MKFTVFADFHHSPSKFMRGGHEDLDIIFEASERENVDFIIHAGDLTHGPARHKEFVERYNNFHIPTYNCLGNHDTDKTPLDETLALYKMERGYYFFDNGGYRIIVLDPNYCKIGDEYIHFDMGNYYKTPEAHDWVPPEQLEWLKETIDTAPGPCIVISHESFEREADGVHNMYEVRKIFNDANKKKPHSVLMVMNGHHHRDFVRILDGILYFEVNSSNYEWVPNAHDCYPRELMEKYGSLKHCLTYTTPVFGIVTVEGTTVTCKGRESELFMGVTREDTGNCKCDKAGREVTPTVQSFKITL